MTLAKPALAFLSKISITVFYFTHIIYYKGTNPYPNGYGVSVMIYLLKAYKHYFSSLEPRCQDPAEKILIFSRRQPTKLHQEVVHAVLAVALTNSIHQIHN